jgi:GH15 family glucan-1,4-alpha-glucosidase
MPLVASGRQPHRPVRCILCVRGRVPFQMEVEPRFDYGRQAHETRLHKHGAVFESPTLTVALSSPVPLEHSEEGIRANSILKAGQSTTFVLETLGGGEEPQFYSEDDTRQAFDDTVAFWQRWLSRSRYAGRWREMVQLEQGL